MIDQTVDCDNLVIIFLTIFCSAPPDVLVEMRYYRMLEHTNKAY